MASEPDLDGVAGEIAARLRRGLAPHLHYHALQHTSEDVVPAARRLAGGERVTGRALLQLVTAAWLHDVGFLVRAEGHELIGVGFAHVLLPDFGYDADDLRVITGLILATRIPQSPTTALERVLCDADLDVLGSEQFFERNGALRAELAAGGVVVNEVTWLAEQIDFLRAHRYFTATGRAERDAGKETHLVELADQLARAVAAHRR